MISVHVWICSSLFLSAAFEGDVVHRDDLVANLNPSILQVLVLGTGSTTGHAWANSPGEQLHLQPRS